MSRIEKIKMKKVKVGPRDVRVGNFVYRDEEDHVKVSDINGAVSQRFSKRIAKGQIIAIAMDLCRRDANQMRFLENYAAVTFNVLCAVPDIEYLDGINRLAVECANRHKEIYGIKEEISVEDDLRIVREEKEAQEAFDELKKAGCDVE